MANEIELKLSLPDSAQRQLLRQPILSKAVSKHTQQLINIYYDTPEFDLQRRGIALRLRKQGRIWLQTVKCAGSSAAGLSSRPEWETRYAGHFDFSPIDAERVRDWLNKPRILQHLVPVFETSFRRTTWRFEPRPGCSVLLMFDRGWTVAAGKRLPISELEIELAAGQEDVGELFRLAEILAERVPLIPSTCSKAERGYRLFQGRTLQPSRPPDIPLCRNDTPQQAFRQIAMASLEHLQSNHEGAIGSDDAEFIHQMRVAVRRLRAAARLFSPCLPAALSDELTEPLRQLGRRLGHVRDLDVLLAEIAAPVGAALPDEPRLAALMGTITDRRYAARTHLLRTLQSIDHGRLLLHAAALLQQGPLGNSQKSTATAPEIPLTLGDFATARLKRLERKVLRLAKASSIDDPGSLHGLRIGIKRLRYALEFFAPLAGKNSLRRRIRRQLRQLVALQESLGQLNDLANAGLLLMHCAGDDPRLREAVTLIGGWHGARHSALLARLPQQIKRLERLKLAKFA